LILATILSGIVGTERSKMGRAAGLRTHILVCLGATIASMTGLFVLNNYNTNGDVTRIAAQVISGIGFLGAGTILIKNKSVTGLTTAACVWATGAIGIAVGYGFYEAAMIGGLLVFFITGKLSNVDKKLYPNYNEISLYIEFKNPKEINTTINTIKEKGNYIGNVKFLPSRNNTEKYIATETVIGVPKEKEIDLICEEINKMDNVYFAVISEK
jgi:putative Mg2+ transporter-C (MgtC) family protein